MFNLNPVGKREDCIVAEERASRSVIRPEVSKRKEIDSISVCSQAERRKRAKGHPLEPARDVRPKSPTPDLSAQFVETPLSEVKLWESFDRKDVNIFWEAIQLGADINQSYKNGNGFPLLYAACSEKFIGLFRAILELGPDLTVTTGKTVGLFDVLVSYDNVLGTAAALKAGARLREKPYWDSVAYKMALHSADFTDEGREIVRLLDEAHAVDL